MLIIMLYFIFITMKNVSYHQQTLLSDKAKVTLQHIYLYLTSP